MSQLPTGTLTFFFSDIEGSTKLLSELGDDFTRVLEAHQRLMRDAFAAHSGIEVSTEGDAFFVVFTDALAGVKAAADAQEALASHDWGEHPVKVRMGLHTGRAVLGGDNYSGIEVNRAARIMSAAHGGQVVVSAATAALVQRELGSRLSLTSLGPHRLKDLEHPEEIHQLSIDGLPDEFPPLRTLDARPNNLPEHLSTFIDRPEEIAAIRGHLAEKRLVTLTGPGGTGKTRLSLEVAMACLSEFRDGAFAVRLAAVIDPELVASTIATELGVKEEGARPTADVLKDHLADKEMLLVLDNFEQVVDAAPLVAELLTAAPGIKMIVTSRAPLRVSGEQESPVPPMALPDPDHLPSVQHLQEYEAVALFLERARSAKPDFELTEQNAEAVVRICHRLDGLPLAIELAAARVRILSPADLYGRLESCLTLLTGGRDLTERQRTLRGAIQWSYDLLDEPQQKFFRSLSVFSGGWSFEAAEKVCDPGSLDIDVLDGLESLVDNSLVRRFETDAGDTRFRMLQTIREFGHDRVLDAGEEDDLKSRHAAYFCEVARERAEGLTASFAVRDQAFSDDDNYRTALAHLLEKGALSEGMELAATLWRYWMVVGHLAEGRTWLERYLGHPDADKHPEARLHAISAIGSISYWQSDFETTRKYYGMALEAQKGLDDKMGLAEAYYNLGFLATVEERYDEGLEYHLQARAIYEELGSERGIATTALGLGINRVLMGDYEASDAYADEAFAFFDPNNEWLGLMMSSFIRYQAFRFTGQYDDAAQVMLAMFDRIGSQLDPASMSSLFDVLADVRASTGRYESALVLSGAAERIKQEVGGSAPPTLIRPADVKGKAAAGGMSEDEIEALWAEGRAMPIDEVVAIFRKEAELDAG